MQYTLRLKSRLDLLTLSTLRVERLSLLGSNETTPSAVVPSVLKWLSNDFMLIISINPKIEIQSSFLLINKGQYVRY